MGKEISLVTADVGSGPGEGRVVLMAFSESGLTISSRKEDKGACQSRSPRGSPVTILSNFVCNHVLLRRNVGGAHLFLELTKDLSSSLALHRGHQLTW